MNSKVRVKHTAAAALFSLGGVRLLRRWRRKRGVILAYHRVLPAGGADLSFTQPGMYVTVESFDRQIRHLARHYRIVALGELFSRPFDRTCAITFDDGWLDTYTYAFPILQKYNAPATIFVATNAIGTGAWAWPDRVCYYTQNAPPERFAAALGSALQEHWRYRGDSGAVLADRHAAAERVLLLLKGLEQRSLDEVMSSLDRSFAALNETLHRNRPWMTWPEVLQLSRQGMSLGSHTENHSILTSVSKDQARAEIVNSRLALSAQIDRPVEAFCYPNGAHDPELVQMVADAGYSVAVTTRRGLVDSHAHPLTLKRLMIHNDMTDTLPMFACTLSDAIPFF